MLKNNETSMKSKIKVNPNIHFGKPHIAGIRILVTDVLELLSEGITFETILKDYYPDLEVEDIQVCVKYAMNVVTAEEIS